MRNPDLLALQCVHQIIDHDGKSDRRHGPSKFFYQLIVTSSFYDGIACSERIAAENDSGIVSVCSTHTQVKTDIIRYIVSFQYFIDSFQTLDCLECFGTRCDPFCLFQDFHAAYKLGKGGKRFPGAALYLCFCQQFVHSEIIPVCDQLP